MARFRLFTMVVAVAALLSFGGCGGGSSDPDSVDNTDFTSTSNESVTPYTNSYEVNVVDDAVLGAELTAVGCTGTPEELGEGRYRLTECAQKPTIIVAEGGYMLNEQGVRIPMGLPLMLDTRQSGSDTLVVTPLTTLATAARDENELQILAERFGISQNELFADLSKDPGKKEILQLLNAQFIAAQENGVLNVAEYLETFKKKILEAGTTDAGSSIVKAVEALDADPAAATLFGTVGFAGYISEAVTINSESLAEYYDNKSIEADKTVFVGFVYDEPIPSAQIEIRIGERTVGSVQADENGKFTMTIDTALLAEDAIVTFTATAWHNNDHVKLVSSTTTATLRDLARQKLSPSDFIDLIISNVTTAEYAMAKKVAGENPTPESFSRALVEMPLKYAETIKETAALIKAYVDDNETNIAEGSDTLSYIQGKLTGIETIELNATETEVLLITQRAEEIENDPVLSMQLDSVAVNAGQGDGLKGLVDEKGGEATIYSIEAHEDATYLHREYKIVDLTYTQLHYRDYDWNNGTWVEDDNSVDNGLFDAEGVFYFTDPKTEPLMVKLMATYTYNNPYNNKSYTLYDIAVGIYKPYDAEFYLDIPNKSWAEEYSLDAGNDSWNALQSDIDSTGSAGYDVAWFTLQADGKVADSLRFEGWEHFTVEGRDFLRIREIGNEDYIVALDFGNKKAYVVGIPDESTIGTFTERGLWTDSFDLVNAFEYLDDATLRSWAAEFGYSDPDDAMPQIIERLITTDWESLTGTADSNDLAALIEGKTYYFPVDDSYYDANGTLINNDHVETFQFSSDGTTLTITWEEGGMTYSSAFNYSIEGDSLRIVGENSDGEYIDVLFTGPASETAEYIGFANGWKLYKTFAAAEAVLKDMSGLIIDLIVGKTYYQHCTNGTSDSIDTITFQTDGIMKIVDGNGTIDEIPYRIELDLVYTIENGVEYAHGLIDFTDTYIKLADIDSTSGETITLYTTYEAAQAAPAVECGG